MIPINTNATTVRVYAGVPLTLGGEDKYYFASASALQTALGAYQVWEGNNLSYQRIKYSVPEGKASYTIILPVSVADLNAGCVNYLSITQNGLTTYCFITDCEMEGSDSSHIEYTPDYFTTFINQATLPATYIVRQHSVTDELFGNLIPENVIEGESIATSVQLKYYSPEINKICAKCTLTPDGQSIAAGKIINHIFTGAEMVTFSTAAEFISYINDYAAAGKLDAVVGVSMVCFDPNNPGAETTGEVIPWPTSINGYTPKNKKVLQYPYCFLRLRTTGGTSKDFCYEGFRSAGVLGVGFAVLAVGGANPTIYAYPGQQYYGVNGKEFSVSVSASVEVAWIGNSYANSVVNEGQKLLWNTLIESITGNIKNANSGFQTFAGGALNSYGGNSESRQASAVRSLAKGITQVITSNIDLAVSQVETAGKFAVDSWIKSKVPGALKGSTGSISLALSETGVGVFVDKMGVLPEIAKAADDYYSMYGYSQQKFDSVNLNSRPSWNFVQTGQAVVKGVMPEMARREIETRFNAGVRLWHVSDIGNYTLANEV